MRRPAAFADFTEKYPDTFHVKVLDVRDIGAIRAVVDRTVAAFGRTSVAVSEPTPD